MCNGYDKCAKDCAISVQYVAYLMTTVFIADVAGLAFLGEVRLSVLFIQTARVLARGVVKKPLKGGGPSL